MIKTEVYLNKKIYIYLKEQSKILHKTVSELVRESINEKMKENIEKIIKATKNVFGIWKDKDFNIENYIREMRKDRTL